MFASAGQAEIVRSNQKDDCYSSYIKGSLADITQSFFGPRAWLRWRQELDLFGDLGYFLLTTFGGFQTIGEEYVNIVQVDDSLRRIPIRWKRGLMILLQVAAPYFIDRCLSRLEKDLRLNPDSSLTPEAKKTFLGAIPVLRHTITLIHRCHLALFYMKGAFYHIAKRYAGIHYLVIRQGDKGSGSSYRILGWLSIIQLMFAFIQHLYKWSIQQRRKQSGSLDATAMLKDDLTGKRKSTETTDNVADPSQKCVLCLEQRSHSTATPCGHMFCWSCITEWCSTKPECPLCREPFAMSRLICLQNYDPS